MEELKKELERVYTLISNIPVRGEDAERLALARSGLRRAWDLAEKGGQADG